MLKDYGQASQRYIWVAKAYGEYDIESDIWRGPFFSRTGIANQSLIDKEASAPGSVLGENYQPQSHKVKTARIKAAAMKQLASLQAGLFRPEGGKVPEKASVLDLLQDGQFPDVIARVKGVTVAEVVRVATENGVKVEYRDSVLDRASLEASSDPMAEARGYQKPRFDEAEDFDDYDDDPGDVPVDPAEPDELDPMDIDTAPQVTEKMTSEELTEFALQMLSDDDEVTAHDILAAAVTATGKTASRQMLTPILRSLKGGA
jgi:predicted outer membrane protein